MIGGRTGLKNEVEKDRDVDDKGEEYIVDYVYDGKRKGCVWYGGRLYIDGYGTKCLDEEENVLCSVCQGK